MYSASRASVAWQTSSRPAAYLQTHCSDSAPAAGSFPALYSAGFRPFSSSANSHFAHLDAILRIQMSCHLAAHCASSARSAVPCPQHHRPEPNLSAAAPRFVLAAHLAAPCLRQHRSDSKFSAAALRFAPVALPPAPCLRQQRPDWILSAAVLLPKRHPQHSAAIPLPPPCRSAVLRHHCARTAVKQTFPAPHRFLAYFAGNSPALLLVVRYADCHPQVLASAPPLPAALTSLRLHLHHASANSHRPQRPRRLRPSSAPACSAMRPPLQDAA